MKKIFFASATIAACFLISCKDEKAAAPADNAAAVKEQSAAFIKSIETGDFSKSKEWLAADAIDHGGHADGSDVKGTDSIIANLQKIHHCFEPGYTMNVISQAVDGDYLFSLVEMRGKTTANPGMGMPPATAMDMRSVDVTKLKDGKASEHWGFASMQDMAKMMAPPPPPPPADKMMPADTTHHK